MSHRRLLIFTACWMIAATVCGGEAPGAAEPANAADLQADSAIAAQAQGLLQKYCYRCHGVQFKYPGLDVLDRETMLRPKDADEEPFVVPGDPDASRLWQMVESGYMPPRRQPQPTDEEKAVLRRWIEQGADFPPAARPQREFVGEDTILEIIARDLEALPVEQRRFARYFSLAHLWNSPELRDEELRIYRAALSKLVNSLSQQFRITPPRAVDPEATVLAIDLRDYGWTDGQQWNQLLEAYPYGLQRGDARARQVYDMTACHLPYVRADWFVFAASRPPLYHDLLGLPENAAQLEATLGVDIRANFQRDRLWRAGISKSGVSAQNRVVERHDARHGAYWKSYDFRSNLERGNIFRFPLGPTFPHAENRSAFRHDGGEIIFHLPNGLQGYLLVDQNDNRIDEGPVDIVSDANQFSDSFTIVNGVSCIGCHKHGLVPFEDSVRATFASRLGSPTGEKVLRLYPEADELKRLVDGDAQRFLAALEQAVGPWLRTDPADDRPITSFAEPVTRGAKLYQRNLSIGDVARELGLPAGGETTASLNIPRADELATVIRVSDAMHRLNLAPLANGDPLPREVWEQVFQQVARELKLGVPISF